jgi:hypothetical protein
MVIFHSRDSVRHAAAVGAPSASTLRVKDVAFLANQIVVRDGKGRKDRVTLLPAVVKASPGRRDPHRRPGVGVANGLSGDRDLRRPVNPAATPLPSRCPAGSRAARPQRREHHGDLHARPEPGAGRGAQSGRPHARHTRRPRPRPGWRPGEIDWQDRLRSISCGAPMQNTKAKEHGIEL